MKKNLLVKTFMIFAIFTSVSFANNMAKSSEMIKKKGNKEVKMTCGAGKCGTGMMKSNLVKKEKNGMVQKSGNKKTKMSCGAGKCGAGMNQ